MGSDNYITEMGSCWWHASR